MITNDYNVIMIRVGIAELKKNLCRHLRDVRRGQEIVVLERSTPIARILPIEGTGANLTVRSARPGVTPSSVTFPPPVNLGCDVVEILLEDRRRER